MYTSMIGLAVSALFATATPTFQTDYRDAKALAARDHKPLVVVLSTGAASWGGLIADGKLDNPTLKTLRDSYVCVYVDVESDKGRRLAHDFEVDHGPAIIISDKTGELQAYRHDGAQPASELGKVLNQYSDQQQAVTRTETNRAQDPAKYFAPVQQQCLT